MWCCCTRWCSTNHKGDSPPLPKHHCQTHRRNKHKKLSKCHPKLLQGGAHLQAGVLLLEEEELLQGQGEGHHHQEQVAFLQERVALLEVRALLEVTLSRKRKRRTKIRMEIWKRYKTVITV